MSKVPELRINPWPPGLADYMPVNLVETSGRVFLCDVPLREAKLIVEVFNFCRKLQESVTPQ